MAGTLYSFDLVLEPRVCSEESHQLVGEGQVSIDQSQCVRIIIFDQSQEPGEVEQRCQMKVIDVPWQGGKSVIWDKTTCNH